MQDECHLNYRLLKNKSNKASKSFVGEIKTLLKT